MRRSIRIPALLAMGLAALALPGCQSQGAPSRPAQASTASAAAPPQAPAEDRTVFEPAQGVRCDRSRRVCEWHGGGSVGLTRLFFSDADADALVPAASAGGYRYDPIFKPNTKVSCDTLVTTCYDTSGASADLTRSYFGRDAADRLDTRRRSTIQRYGSYITCDKLSSVCYDRLGAGVGVTRLYLGEPESDRLLARLRSNI